MSIRALAWWLACVAAALGTPAMAQNQAELDKQIKEAAELPEHMKQAVDQVVRQLTDIEGEQKALLKKLGEADERARQEKARADALASQLAKLTGSTPPSEQALSVPETTAPNAAPLTQPAPTHLVHPTLATVTIPERRTNGLGMVETAAKGIANVDPACNGVRFVPWSELESSPGALRIEQAEGKVVFVHDDGVSAGVPLATISVGGGKLAWSWADRVPGSARDTLASLDRWLATGLIEASAQDSMVGQWQVAPVRVGMKLPKSDSGDAARNVTVAGPGWATELPLGLAAEELHGWIVEAEAGPRMRLLSADATMTLEWHSGNATLAVQFQPMPSGTNPHLENQIAAWEKDVKSAREHESPNEREIARMEGELNRLQTTLAALDAVESTTNPEAPRRVVVRAMASNGVTCIRYELQPE